VRAVSAVVLGLVICSTGCGGEERKTTSAKPPCSPGLHTLTLPNAQAAQMRVTPGGRGDKALVVVLHGAGQTPADGLAAFRGGWKEPGLVLIAPAAKGETWSGLLSQEDRDLESVNLVLAQAYKRCRIDRTRIAVGGFSDGATYALTLGVSNGDLFPAIMALSPGGILAQSRLGHPRIFVSHGTLDGVLPIGRAGDAVVRLLRGLGYQVTYRRFKGGHEAPTAVSAAAIRWFLAGAG
jgi:phospholipase/carboxylesterase